MPTNINSGSYAQYDDFDSIPYKCFRYLMDNDELIWKLIKYETANAWEMPNLTRAEKAALIYAGQDDLTSSRAFLSTRLPDVWTHEICIVRISAYNIMPENRTIGTMGVLFDAYCHWKIDHLSNYKTRTDMIAQRFLQVFNGAKIFGVGNLFFDRVGSEGNRLEQGGQIPFGGKWIVMSNKSA